MTDFPLLRAAGLDADVRLSERIGASIDQVAISFGARPEDFAVLYRRGDHWFHWNDACREQPLETVGDVRRHMTLPSDCPEALPPPVYSTRDQCGARERRPGRRSRVYRRARGAGRRRREGD